MLTLPKYNKDDFIKNIKEPEFYTSKEFQNQIKK